MQRSAEAPSTMSGISRRRFLTVAAAVPACISFPLPAASGTSETRPTGFQSRADFYSAHKDRFLDEFVETNEGARNYLASKYGRKMADAVADESLARFRVLLPDIPYIGGFGNPNTTYLLIAAWCEAWHGPMSRWGKSAENTMRILYDFDKTELAEILRKKALAEGAKKFSKQSLEKTRAWAEWTQRRSFEGDWVAYFVAGDGHEFDFGYDYTECGVVKYFRKHNSMAPAPYFCLNDFIRSQTLGTGLRRSKTLAQGDDVCNFRYKKGRPVLQNWESEVPKFHRA
ncbi:MAG: L-2-amino-thiazoline-4-carboxylic acid hydrolase [Deltaproteobacteria bacterium]